MNDYTNTKEICDYEFLQVTLGLKTYTVKTCFPDDAWSHDHTQDIEMYSGKLFNEYKVKTSIHVEMWRDEEDGSLRKNYNLSEIYLYKGKDEIELTSDQLVDLETKVESLIRVK